MSTNALLIWTPFMVAIKKRGLRWSGCSTSISSSVKVIALVVSKKARLACDSAVKHSIPKSTNILIRDFVATLLASSPNPSWLNSDLNLGFFWRVLTMLSWKDPSDFFASAGFPWITTATTPFTLWLGKGFLCTFGSF